MLEFIIGRAGTGKTTYCLDRIEEKLRQSPQGNPLVLLLPDHMTFALERQLAYNLKDVGGFSRAYVLGMSRLAYQILMRCGGAICPHLSEIGKQLLLSRVLSRQKLSILAKAARQQHFTSSVASIIEEFKRPISLRSRNLRIYLLFTKGSMPRRKDATMIRKIF